jgi:hypothetical protein
MTVCLLSAQLKVKEQRLGLEKLHHHLKSINERLQKRQSGRYLRPSNVYTSSFAARVASQIDQGIRRRDETFLKTTFEQHMHPTTKTLRIEKLPSILSSLGAKCDDPGELFDSVDVNKDGALDFDDFKRVVSVSTDIQRLIQTLPISHMVADALPKESGQDSVRNFCEITSEQVKIVCASLLPFLEKMLIEYAAQLKNAYEIMEKNRDGDSQYSSKFELTPMSVGNIDNFHEGLASRIGTLDLKSFRFHESSHMILSRNFTSPLKSSIFQVTRSLLWERQWRANIAIANTARRASKPRIMVLRPVRSKSGE